MTGDDCKINEALRFARLSYPDTTARDRLGIAQTLINLLPSLTMDGQSQASEHICTLLDDDQWSILDHIWRNPASPPNVIDVFATDLLSRGQNVHLPAMLEAIRIPNHHSNEEAKTTMMVFLDEDFGDDVDKWETAMKAYLKKIEREEKEANDPAPGALQ